MTILREAASTVVAGAIVGGCIAALMPSRSAAQSSPSESEESSEVDAKSEEVAPPSTLKQNRRRLDINRKGMGALLGWAAGNMAFGAYGWATAERERAKYFHQMNLMWNTVNAAIGGIGLAQAINEDPDGLTTVETIEKTRSMQQILLFNAGLDVAYVATGFWLRERGGNSNDVQLSGYGDSLLIQGGFLFAFDLVLWGLHQQSLADFKATVRPAFNGEAPGAVLSVDF